MSPTGFTPLMVSFFEFIDALSLVDLPLVGRASFTWSDNRVESSFVLCGVG